MNDPSIFKTLFYKFLRKKGISKSRINDLETAFIILHKALCRMDEDNLELVTRLGGVQELLQRYAEIEELRNVGLELKELREVLNLEYSEQLPLILSELKTQRARCMAESILKR
jgi:hypothetical protein